MKIKGRDLRPFAVLFMTAGRYYFYPMQGEVIQLSEVIYKMEKGERFDIEFVSADKRQGTGGLIKKMGNCVLYSAIKKDKSFKINVDTLPKIAKNPKHFENSTRNIYSLQEKKTRKVHLRLITRFNGKQVL